MPSHDIYIVCRSHTEESALARLQSEPLLLGLKELGRHAYVCSPADVSALPENCCLLFHYNDAKAIRALEACEANTAARTVVCIASDIYEFQSYISLNALVDFYTAPTDHHRRVLGSQLYRPVFTVPEGIDPIAKSKTDGLTAFPHKHSKRLLWFGYPESFHKGMVSITRVLRSSLAADAISSFALLSTHHLESTGFPVLTYSNETFESIARDFDYCILSHFPLDLQINSHIKSPNKLLTAIHAGLIPLASDTPNYRDVLSEFGLERFLFDSPGSLNQLLSSLDPDADSSFLRQSAILETTAERYSNRQVATTFLEAMAKYETRSVTLDGRLRPEDPPGESEIIWPNLPLSFHLHGLRPSLLLWLREHLRRFLKR